MHQLATTRYDTARSVALPTFSARGALTGGTSLSPASQAAGALLLARPLTILANNQRLSSRYRSQEFKRLVREFNWIRNSYKFK